MKFSEGFAGRGHSPRLTVKGNPRPLSQLSCQAWISVHSLQMEWTRVLSILANLAWILLWFTRGASCSRIPSHWVRHNSWSLSATLFWVPFMVLICGLPQLLWICKLHQNIFFAALRTWFVLQINHYNHKGVAFLHSSKTRIFMSCEKLLHFIHISLVSHKW